MLFENMKTIPSYQLVYNSKTTFVLVPLCREPEGLVPGIRVKGLRKEFSKLGSRKRVLAVDGVSFSAYPGQITTLLGHNGAGNLEIRRKIDFVEDLGLRRVVD